MSAIAETLAMAFLGTLIAAIVALPLGFLGARNVLRLEFLRFLSRRGFDVLRSLEQLILALIFIRAFGLGPLAGIFAIAVSDIGSLSKLFAEAIENVDRRPIEGVRAAGGGKLQVLRLAVLPQVLPVLLSNVLYYFESNTRSASILGIVGAGGIGYPQRDRDRRWLPIPGPDLPEPFGDRARDHRHSLVGPSFLRTQGPQAQQR